VPPQDAQLQGVVSSATKHNNQTQTVKLPPQDAQLQRVEQIAPKHNNKDRCKTNKKSLQGQVHNSRWMKDKASKASKGKKCATSKFT